MLNFEKININMKQMVDKYYFLYGEGSCQHSFAANYILSEKYDDYFCEHDNVLYVLRNGLSDATKRVYLFPMCDYKDTKLVKSAIENIIDDAHSMNKKVAFESITENASTMLNGIFKDKFNIVDFRDLYEYIYKYDDFVYMKGHNYYKKRNEISAFVKKYENRIIIKSITKDDIENIKKLSHIWLTSKIGWELNEHLHFENRALYKAFDNYDALCIKGVVIYIDSELAGFIIGTNSAINMFDAMIEKGNPKYNGIYKLLNREFPKLCCKNFEDINFEEDLGVEGLRKMKTMYHPAYYIKKFIATEV